MPTERPIAVTTVEVGERRHLVQPYTERPVVELRDGVVACHFCGNGNFRRSRLRFTDLLEILLLRYPVRCTRCSQRQYVESAIALLAYPPKQAGPRPAKGDETWRNWTAADAAVQTARPLSTARMEQISKTQRATTPTPRTPSRGEDDYSVW